jgi:hypothetical protein
MQREGLVKVSKRLGPSIVERTHGRNPKAIRVSDTGSSRRRIHETKSPDSQNPQSIMTICKEDMWQAVKVLGKSPKGDFNILATGRYKGKELELLTHKILKERKSFDQGRLTTVDLPLKWNFVIPGFVISALRDTGVRRVKNCYSQNHEILKHENSKEFEGIAPAHGTGSRGQDPSREIFTCQPFLGSSFWSFEVQHFINPKIYLKC